MEDEKELKQFRRFKKAKRIAKHALFIVAATLAVVVPLSLVAAANTDDFNNHMSNDGCKQGRTLETGSVVYLCPER